MRRSIRYLLAGAVALLVVGFVIGAIISWVRFRTAQLPAVTAVGDLGVWSVLLAGLWWVVRAAIVFVILGDLAYLVSARKWDQRGPEWHRVVVAKGVRKARLPAPSGLVGRRAPPVEGPVLGERAPLGERAVRVLAGINIGVLAGVFTALVVTTVQRLLLDKWWVSVPLALALFGGAYWALTEWGPLKVGARTHAIVWIVVALIAVFLTTVPLGLVILIGVVISTAGRKVVRSELPRTPFMFLRSPLTWLTAVVFTVVGVAWYALAPVPFQRDSLSTTAGPRVVGYLAKGGSGTYVVTCQALADATAYHPRITFVSASEVLRSKLGGAPYYMDSGDRPSLATLAMRPAGVHVRLPVPVGTGLHGPEQTCAGTGPSTLSHGFEDPSLGAGVIAGPAPRGGRAVDGDPPIEQTSPGIAALARELQPTLEVSIADRDWPVSVGALLADRGPHNEMPCLHQKQSPQLICPVTLKTLSRSEGQAGDYLQYPTPQSKSTSPSPLSGEPEVEFQPFEAGQGVLTGSLHHWLADPGILNPWASAQIYFVDAGVVRSGFPGWPVHDPRVPAGLLNLEYWFFYQYNYYPTVFDRHVMGDAPLRGDLVNTDLHQGDWEHVDVLVNPVTRKPQWLYLARHANEGVFIRWDRLGAALQGTHAIIQAAFGGHPSYTTCGEQHRNTPIPLSDWVSCGAGRFAFAATTTPLVDLRATGWGCWKGDFGYAGPDTVSTATDDFLHQASTKYYNVAGPPSPLRQAENSKLGLCR